MTVDVPRRDGSGAMYKWYWHKRLRLGGIAMPEATEGRAASAAAPDR